MEVEEFCGPAAVVYWGREHCRWFFEVRMFFEGSSEDCAFHLCKRASDLQPQAQNSNFWVSENVMQTQSHVLVGRIFACTLSISSFLVILLLASRFLCAAQITQRVTQQSQYLSIA